MHRCPCGTRRADSPRGRQALLVARPPDRGGSAAGAGPDRPGCYDFSLSGRIQSSHGAAADMNSPGIATPATRPTIARKTSEISIMQRSSRRAMASLYLEDHLDLDRNVHGQSAHAHGRARVLADGLAEHFDHQVGEAVDHLGLVTEAVRRVHHAEHLDDAADLVEAAEVRAHRGEEREPDLPRDLIARSTVRSLPTLPCEVALPSRTGPCPETK